MLCIFYHNFFKWMNQSQKQFYQSCRKVNKWQVILYMMCVLVTQSHLILCDPMDCSPPGSSVHGIPQARILEWVAISFSTIHDTCSKLQTMTEFSSHSISNTRPDFSSGRGIRRQGLSMNHTRSQGPFRAARQHQVYPKELAHLWPARSVLFLHLSRNLHVRLCTRKFPCFWNFRLCIQFLTL